jgi:hypothetical protein
MLSLLIHAALGLLTVGVFYRVNAHLYRRDWPGAQDLIITNAILFPLWTMIDGPRRGLRGTPIYFIMSLFTSFGFAMGLYLAAQERQVRRLAARSARARCQIAPEWALGGAARRGGARAVPLQCSSAQVDEQASEVVLDPSASNLRTKQRTWTRRRPSVPITIVSTRTPAIRSSSGLLSARQTHSRFGLLTNELSLV